MSTRKRKMNPRHDEVGEELPVKRAKSTGKTPIKRTAAPRKRRDNPKHAKEDYEDREDDEDGEGDQNDEYFKRSAKSTSERPAQRTATPRKRKANSKYDDEDDGGGDEDEISVKAATPASETPTKRTAARRTRRANPKYDDDDDEEEEPPANCVKPASQTPAKRTPAARAVKAKRNDPEWLVTNEKSPLAYEDLHAELSNPRTYEGFTKEDWEDLRSTLLENVPLEPDGYSISNHFLRYDHDFRRGIREFQEDLSTGRLEPEWQAAAAEAMEKRARGDFDDYKEKNFEEFWGQKQKLDYHSLAGDSAKVTLETMIENGMFKIGDEVVFTRAIGRKEKRVLIEKELKIIAVGDRTLTFAIPPGQLKFARPTTTPQQITDPKSDDSVPQTDKTRPVTALIGSEKDEGKSIEENKLDGRGSNHIMYQHNKPDKGEPQADEAQPVIASVDTQVDRTEADGAGNIDDGPVPDMHHMDTSDEGRPLARDIQPVTEAMNNNAEDSQPAGRVETNGNTFGISRQGSNQPDEGEALANEAQPMHRITDTSAGGTETAKAHETRGDGPELGMQECPAPYKITPSVNKVQPVNEVTDARTDNDRNSVRHDTDGREHEDITKEPDAAALDSGPGGRLAISTGQTNGQVAPPEIKLTSDSLLVPNPEPPELHEAMIHHEIKTLTQLMARIIEIDGRLDPKDIKQVPASSPWKFMRLKRDNQDLGALFEMRDEFYAYKLPKLTKKTKKR